MGFELIYQGSSNYVIGIVSSFHSTKVLMLIIDVLTYIIIFPQVPM